LKGFSIVLELVESVPLLLFLIGKPEKSKYITDPSIEVIEKPGLRIRNKLRIRIQKVTVFILVSGSGFVFRIPIPVTSMHPDPGVFFFHKKGCQNILRNDTLLFPFSVVLNSDTKIKDEEFFLIIWNSEPQVPDPRNLLKTQDPDPLIMNTDP
jgi:hypothetical protein